MKNCPNCGAAIEPYESTCPYCGTYYLDLTGIDFTNKQPVYVKFRTEQWHNGKLVPVEITQKAVPIFNSIDVNTDTYDMIDWSGNISRRFVMKKTCNTNITFEAIADMNDNIFTVRFPDA